MRCVGLINKLLQSGATPAVPPTPTTPCYADREMVLSREGDCTGRAVRKQSCLFDFETPKTRTP